MFLCKCTGFISLALFINMYHACEECLNTVSMYQNCLMAISNNVELVQKVSDKDTISFNNQIQFLINFKQTKSEQKSDICKCCMCQ